MSASVLYMSMSLDGYIAGPNDEPGNPGGDGFMRLHEWFVTPDGEFGRPPGPAGELYDEMRGDRRGAGGPADRGAGRSLGRRSSRRPDLRAQPPAARPVGRELSAGDVRDRRDRERDGAGEGRRRGPGRAWCTARTRRSGRSRPACWTSCRSIRSRCCSVGGRRLFDVLPSRVELEIVRVIDTPEATHIRYRVRR